MDLALDSGVFQRKFALSRDLPYGYGVGLDERVVEFPWLLSQGPSGRTLDAGSTLNHSQIIERFLPRVSSLCIATLRPEETAFTERCISYVYTDLRELPFRDGFFDTVICASTLEHVGMDNAVYGDSSPRSEDPLSTQATALGELFRVTAPGGLVLVTLPYGRAEDHNWFRQYDRTAVEQLIQSVGAAECSTTVYAYGRRGWRLADLDKASRARYRDYRADSRPVHDRAAAARAVACIKLRRQ